MKNSFKFTMRLFVWSLVISSLILYLVLNLRIVSNIDQFMPASYENNELQALMIEMQNGPSANTLMIRLSGSDGLNLSDASKELAGTLVAKSDIFSGVHNNNSLVSLDTVDNFVPYRYLLVDEDWGANAIKKHMNKRIIELRTGAGATYGDSLKTDPQLSFIKYLRGIHNASGPALHNGVWFDKTLKSAILLVNVRSDSFNLDVIQHAMQEITTSVSHLSSSIDVEIAGPGVMAVETRSTIEGEITKLSVFMTFLLILVFLFAYRSLYLLLLAGIPLLTAIIVSLTVTQFVFNEVHGIVLAFGITLLGVCLDYPLHLFSHLRKGIKASTSINRIWPTLLLSSVSSVLAYLALLGSNFHGLSQLAVFAACGLFSALIVTRYLLPYIVSPDTVNLRLASTEPSFTDKHKMFIGGLLLCLPLLVILQTDDFWQTSIDAISPIPAAYRDSDRELRHDLNIPEVSHVFLQSDKRIENVLQMSEVVSTELLLLKETGLIRGVWSPSMVLPSKKIQVERQQTLPTELQLSRNLNSALQGLPFRSKSFDTWIDSVVNSKNLSPLMYENIEDTPLMSSLEQGLFKAGDVWISVIRISGVRSDEEFLAWLETKPAVNKTHVQVKLATEKLLSDYRNSTFERFISVVAVLSFIIFIILRSLPRSIKILLPVSIGLLSGIAMPLLLGASINVFHLLALLLVLGMGLDYSLFFNRLIEDSMERQQTVHAISVSAVTTSMAFLALSFSSVPVMASMGQVVSAGVVMCFISSWLLSSSSSDQINKVFSGRI